MALYIKQDDPCFTPGGRTGRSGQSHTSHSARLRAVVGLPLFCRPGDSASPVLTHGATRQSGRGSQNLVYFPPFFSWTRVPITRRLAASVLRRNPPGSIALPALAVVARRQSGKRG